MMGIGYSVLTNLVFGSGHSMATALLKIANDIQHDCDRRLVTFLLLLDFSKAFDNVRHSLLLKKLSLYFKYPAVALVGSYLSDRFQCVAVGGILSELITFTRSVVQGFVLGPLLFSIFINDIVAYIEFCRLHMYADDVHLYLSDDPCSLDECICRMNADLHRLYIWAAENGLCLNPEKSQAIVIGFPGCHAAAVQPV
jgi:hypothetical protein